jgi:Fic family protein
MDFKNETFERQSMLLLKPSFDSNLVDLIIDLDHLRKKKLGGTTQPNVFFQLKNIFHILESIGSARLEGNRTTVTEYIEKKIKSSQSENEKDSEISNLEGALEFIDDVIETTPINRAFVSELHKRVVSNLIPPPHGEGSKSPGEFRKTNIEITGASHKPTDQTLVNDYMNEFFDFVNNNDSSKYDLLKMAIAHHRFTWIHPFDNGNGRTVRLLTYAMLVKQGFNVNVGRIINPTAIFCIDRDKYNDALSIADSGEEEGLLEWCEYVLVGLKNEIEKIDKLLNYEFLKTKILIPAINISLERKIITDLESKILKTGIEKQVFMSSDIEHHMPGKAHTERYRTLKKLKDKKMITTAKPNSKKYVLRFDNNYLLRGIIQMLEVEGFIPIKN